MQHGCPQPLCRSCPSRRTGRPWPWRMNLASVGPRCRSVRFGRGRWGGSVAEGWGAGQVGEGGRVHKTKKHIICFKNHSGQIELKKYLKNKVQQQQQQQQQQLYTTFVNPFTAMLAAQSLRKRPIKAANLKPLRLFCSLPMST